MIKITTIKTIYLAGGCFWGLEKLMESIPGVTNTVCGYANGSSKEDADYKTVCTGRTGFRETVRVDYNIEIVSLEKIVFAFFRVIDPTCQNTQGNDKGTQYQTGIYYVDEDSKIIIEHIIDVEKKRYKTFSVEIKPLESFFDAEEYHQKYLDKNPNGYCHISPEKIKETVDMIIDPAKYPRPSDEDVEKKLSREQFMITQMGCTELPYQNEFNEHHERGIYVDIVTGEPLFSSSDKFDTICGWPGFSTAIDDNTIVPLIDNGHGMKRTEVRSRTGNSHLGHVFYNDEQSPNGTRYCINSASLRFVPFDSMESEGYGYLKRYVH